MGLVFCRSGTAAFCGTTGPGFACATALALSGSCPEVDWEACPKRMGTERKKIARADNRLVRTMSAPEDVFNSYCQSIDFLRGGWQFARAETPQPPDKHTGAPFNVRPGYGQVHKYLNFFPFRRTPFLGPGAPCRFPRPDGLQMIQVLVDEFRAWWYKHP